MGSTSRSEGAAGDGALASAPTQPPWPWLFFQAHSQSAWLLWLSWGGEL